MKIAHVLSEERRHRRALRILLIGCGGNGSAVLFGLPYLHHALIAWGNPWGIDVTVMDADSVSPTNCVRQPFGAADVGQNKATNLVNRINMFHGLIWRSEEALFSGERRNVSQAMTPHWTSSLVVSTRAVTAAKYMEHSTIKPAGGDRFAIGWISETMPAMANSFSANP